MNSYQKIHVLGIGLMQSGVNIIKSLLGIDKATDSMQANPHYFAHKALREDIKEKLVLDQPETDIMVYTYPCIKYAAIADIHGDRTVSELLDSLRPEIVIIENPPGMKKFNVKNQNFIKRLRTLKRTTTHRYKNSRLVK